MIVSTRSHLTRFLATAAVGLAVFVAGCGGGDEPAAKVGVAAAFSPLQELATQIGGPQVASTDLTPLGGQPHDLVPAAPALTALKKAKVVLFLGGTFQPAVAAAAEKLPAATTKVDLASDATLEPSKRVPGVRGQIEGASQTSGPDPHVWLDPDRFAAMAQKTQAALVAADPDHRADYEARGGKYVAELSSVAAEFKQGLGTCKRKVLLTTHPAWGYLAERQGLRQAVVGGITPGAAMDPTSLAALSDYAERTDSTTLFTTVALPARQASALKRATGLTVQPLNPVEGLTQEERDRGDDYASIMRENLRRLAEGLDCEGAAPTS